MQIKQWVIQVQWSGRLGNRMLQHAGACVLAHHSGNKLQNLNFDLADMSQHYPDFKEYFSCKPDHIQLVQSADSLGFFGSKDNIIGDDWLQQHCDDLSVLGAQDCFYAGYFQVQKFLIRYYKEIKEVFQPVKPLEPQEGVLVHARLGDLSMERSGTYEYYHKVLTQLQCTHGYITTDPMNRHDDMIQRLQKEFNLQLYHDTPANTLNFARGFNAVVACTGTFSWWLAALSDAPTVYYYNIPREHAWHAPIFDMPDWQAA
jgi:hypothetical protein